MAVRSIRREATNPGSIAGTARTAPVYVDSDDNILKFIPAGSGTTEVQIVDASSTQTLTNKTLTTPTITTPTISGAATIATGSTLTTPIINGATGTLAIEVVTVANDIAASESGTTYFLNTAGGFDSVLPLKAAGLFFRFIVKTAPTTAYTVSLGGGDSAEDIMVGMVTSAGDSAADAETTAGADVLTFVANTATLGDGAEFYCDGTLWYVRAWSAVNAAITFTG